MTINPLHTGLRGIKVLIIDDSSTIRNTASSLLQKAGCNVICAHDGYEALAMVIDERPDIIFVDVMMPRLDGYQTCALIKQNHDFKSVPVVLLTSKDGLFDRARGRMVGADRYLTKPFSTDELIETIRSLVEIPDIDNGQLEAQL